MKPSKDIVMCTGPFGRPSVLLRPLGIRPGGEGRFVDCPATSHTPSGGVTWLEAREIAAPVVNTVMGGAVQ